MLFSCNCLFVYFCRCGLLYTLSTCFCLLLKILALLLFPRTHTPYTCHLHSHSHSGSIHPLIHWSVHSFIYTMPHFNTTIVLTMDHKYEYKHAVFILRCKWCTIASSQCHQISQICVRTFGQSIFNIWIVWVSERANERASECVCVRFRIQFSEQFNLSEMWWLIELNMNFSILLIYSLFKWNE